MGTEFFAQADFEEGREDEVSPVLRPGTRKACRSG